MPNKKWELIPKVENRFLDKPVIAVENTIYNRMLEYQSTQFVGKTKSYVERVKFALNVFEQYCQTRPLTPELLGAFPTWLEIKRGNTPSSVDKTCSLVRAFFVWCRKMRYTPENYADFIPIVTTRPTRNILTFSLEEYDQLKQKSEGNILMYRAFITGYNTGMHLCDVCHLRWSHIDLDSMMVRIPRMKMERILGERAICHIPIITNSDFHLELLKMIEEEKSIVRSEEDQDYVFPELVKLYNTGPIFRLKVCRVIRKVSKKKSFITFRRTLLSNLANSGMNLALACKVSGHTDPKTFLKYTKPDEEAIRGGMEQALEYAKKTTKPQPNPKQIKIQIKPDRS